MKRSYTFRNVLFTCIIFLITNHVAFGQIAENVDPTVSQFPRISGGDGEPDFRGDLNLSIPLMTVPGRGGLDYDITLNYVNGNGIPASEAASWVGLGWNLNAYQIACSPAYALNDPSREGGCVYSEGKDMYYLNYPGGSTPIYEFDDGWRPLEWSAIKIEAIAGTNINVGFSIIKKDFTQFEITDLDGTRYIFKNRLAQESMNKLQNHCVDASCSHRDGRSGVHPYFYVFKLSWILGPDYVDDGDGEPDDGDQGSWIKLNYTDSIDVDNIYLGSSVRMQINYLESIETPTHKAVFHKTDSDGYCNIFMGLQQTGFRLKELEYIELLRKGSLQVIKKVYFDTEKKFPWAENQISNFIYYTLITENYCFERFLRLRLNSVRFVGQGGEELPPYIFKYYPDPTEDDPGYHQIHVSAWGHFSHDEPNVADPDPDPDSTFRACMLKSVTYPTGDSVRFEYDTDKYQTYILDWRGSTGETPIEAGGVRLWKKKIFHLQTGKIDTLVYNYATTNGGYGYLSGEPLVNNKTTVNIIPSNGIGSNYHTDVHYPDVKITQPDGSYIFRYYTTAVTGVAGTGYLSGGQDFGIGQDQYFNLMVNSYWGAQYSNNLYFSYFEARYPYMWDNLGCSCPYNNSIIAFLGEAGELDDENSLALVDNIQYTYQVFDNGWKRGHITEEQLYSSTGDMVQETKYFYHMIPMRSNLIPVGITEEGHSPTPKYPTSVTSGWVQMIDRAISQYENGYQYTAFATTYNYNSTNGLVAEKKEYDDPYRLTKIKYAYEYYNGMLSKNMLSQMAQQTVYEFNANGEYERSSAVTTWKENWGYGSGQWAPHKTYEWLENDGIGTYSLPLFNFTDWSGDTEPPSEPEWLRTSKVLSRDQHGNIKQTVDALGYITETEWSSTYACALPTKITRWGDPSTSSDNLVVTLAYDPDTFQMTSKTDENGTKTNYTYDGLQRLTEIKNHDNALLEKYDYYYSRYYNTSLGKWTDYDPVHPNSIKTTLYPESGQSNSSITFSDGGGREIQTQVTNGSSAIITMQEYNDEVNKVEKQYAPREIANANQHYMKYIQTSSNWNYPSGNQMQSNTIYDAAETMTINAAVTNSGVQLRAGTQIRLLPGFSVASGTPFHADVDPLWPKETFEYENNPLARVTRQVHGDGEDILYQYTFNQLDPNWYDSFYSVTQITDEKNKVIQNFANYYERDIGSIDGVNSPKTIKWANKYDVMGNLIELAPPNRYSFSSQYYNSWTHYNTLSQIVEKYSPDEQTSRYIYDNNGNLRFSQNAAQKNSSGKFTVYKYDAHNRVTLIGEEKNYAWNDSQQPDPTNASLGTGDNEWVVKYTYDTNLISGLSNSCVGRLSGIDINDDTDAASEHTIRVAYDMFGNLKDRRTTIDILQSGLAEKIIQYQHDQIGRVKKIIYPSGVEANQQYDEAGRLSSIPGYVNYTYNASGQPIRTEYANGVVETNTYNPYRGWLSQRNYQLGGSALFYFTNSYDAAGNVTVQQYKHGAESSVTENYYYDALHRLDAYSHNGTPTQDYEYDANGNRVTAGGMTFTYNSNTNKLASFTGSISKTFGYDAAGRVTTLNSKTLSYDILNNMKSYGSDSYVYDDANQRIRKTENSVKTFYIRDNMNVLAEYDGSGNLTANYVYGIDGIVAKVIPSVGTKYFYKDHLGSTRQVDTAQQIRYYPYGGISQMSGSETDYLFTGKENDGHTEGDLTYFGARYYDPIIGRWLIPDPLAGKYPSLSPYVYAANNPMKFIDPNGMRINKGEDIFDDYWKRVNADIVKTQNEISKISSQMGKATGKDASKLNEEISSLQNKLGELNTVSAELNRLEQSEQVYNLQYGANPEWGGGLTYNTKTSEINVTIYQRLIGNVAHELKHAYQWDTGQISFGPKGRGYGLLGDLTDEVIAYERGAFFGNRMPTLKEIKTAYPGLVKFPYTISLTPENIEFYKKQAAERIDYYFEDWNK